MLSARSRRCASGTSGRPGTRSWMPCVRSRRLREPGRATSTGRSGRHTPGESGVTGRWRRVGRIGYTDTIMDPGEPRSPPSTGTWPSRGLALEAVVVGGAALSLLGVITRQTRDCDILHPALPPEVLAAARAFAAEVTGRRRQAQGEDWLNNGPSALAPLLPAGWELRLARRPSAAGYLCCALSIAPTCSSRSSSPFATEPSTSLTAWPWHRRRPSWTRPSPGSSPRT